MLFNSGEFLLFFPIVVLLYYIIPDKAKNYWLLISSYYFYMSWNAEYALLLLLVTATTYFGGLVLHRIKEKTSDAHITELKGKLVVAFGTVLNLGVLFYFKYSGFGVSVIEHFFSIFGIRVSIPIADVILPVGISFYTFQSLAYLIDVYREEIPAEKNFFKYALFVSFFPQLVAGPIERSRNLLSQLSSPRKYDFDKSRDGFLLMLWGFFVKIVIADRIAIFVDTIYGYISAYPGCYLLVATILFAFQIYCDFSGYSIIAMGAAEILGIDLMENFDAPYFSRSVVEFWRRWHISLTSWFKDYLYIPLGGNRKGKLRKNLNRMVVFLASGLWHGASFSFVIWGGLNGFYQVLGDLLHPVREWGAKVFHINTDWCVVKALRVIVTFILVDFAWIFFRAGSYSEAKEIIVSILTVRNEKVLFDGSLYWCGLDIKNFWFMIVALLILAFADYCKYSGICIRKIISRQGMVCRSVIIALAIAVVLTFGIWGPTYNEANFIYFQF